MDMSDDQPTPDADGYYTVNISTYPTVEINGRQYLPNGKPGVVYDKTAYLDTLLNPEGSFQRRLAAGQIRGEMGNPRKGRYQTIDSFKARVVELHEDNCVFVMLPNSLAVTEEPTQLTVTAKVKPVGKFKGDVVSLLENNSASFAIRAFAYDGPRVDGAAVSKPFEIVTWDLVPKYFSAGVKLNDQWLAERMREGADGEPMSADEFFSAWTSGSSDVPVGGVGNTRLLFRKHSMFANSQDPVVTNELTMEKTLATFTDLKDVIKIVVTSEGIDDRNSQHSYCIVKHFKTGEHFVAGWVNGPVPRELLGVPESVEYIQN